MEKERLHFCIERFDHYFDSINNKAALFLALATFIVGGLVASYPYFQEHVECGFWINSLFIIDIALGLTIIITVLLASIPFVSKGTTSLHYFGSICVMGKSGFEQRSQVATTDDELIDLREQVHLLSIGLNNKFKKLRIVGIMFIIQFILLIPTIITLLVNVK